MVKWILKVSIFAEKTHVCEAWQTLKPWIFALWSLFSSCQTHKKMLFGNINFWSFIYQMLSLGMIIGIIIKADIFFGMSIWGRVNRFAVVVGRLWLKSISICVRQSSDKPQNNNDKTILKSLFWYGNPLIEIITVYSADLIKNKNCD